MSFTDPGTPPAPPGTTTPTSSLVRGALVVLEGTDRSGKSTQATLLAQRLTSSSPARQAPLLLCFPDRTTPTGQMIDSYLRSRSGMSDHAVHLFFSANRWEAAASMHEALKRGRTVVCDRYYYSGIIYSVAKGRADLDVAWARGPEVGLPRPDMVVFLDVGPETARARGGFGEEKYEQVEMQKRVRELFLDMGRGRVETVRMREEEEDMLMVDAAGTTNEVAEEIWKAVRPKIEAVERGEMGRTVRRVS